MTGDASMSDISVIKKAPDGRFYIKITRGNGTSYRVVSEDRKSIEDYQSEVLAAIEQKKQRGR